MVPIWIAIGSLILAAGMPTAPAAVSSQSRAGSILKVTVRPAFAAHDPEPKKDRIHPGPVAFETIYHSEFGHARPGITVINDPVSWAAFWQQNCGGLCAVNLTSGMIIMPPVPQIDFTTHTVLVASPGQEGSPGYQFSINRVTDRAHQIILDSTLTTPGNYCVWIQPITFPEQIVIIPRTNLPATLSMNTVQAPPCPL